VGKVLSDAGSGPDSAILAGINWAIAQGCRVISMSLSSPPSQSFVAYERAAKAALRTTAIIAAAGNESNRRAGLFKPVGPPANANSIMAVAAVDSNLRVANFSNRGSIAGGGIIDIAGPGVDVYSAAPGGRYQRMSGTSMATPHVAGIAALVAQARPGWSGGGILNGLRLLAKQAGVISGGSMQDIGEGLIVAPT